MRLTWIYSDAVDDRESFLWEKYLTKVPMPGGEKCHPQICQFHIMHAELFGVET